MGDQIEESKRRRTLIIQTVKLFVMENGYWPSVMDISRETDIPESSARRHVMMLVHQEVLQIANGERGITLGLPEITNQKIWRKDGDDA